MARRFFYVSLGILALSLAYQLGANRAAADVDLGNPGPIAACGPLTWDASGTSWVATGVNGWTEGDPNKTLPIPAAEVSMVSEGNGTIMLSATDGRCCYIGGGGGWTAMQPYPSGPVTVESSSFGAIKGKFR